MGTQEEEKSSICQVERLQWRVQFAGTINRLWNMNINKQYTWQSVEDCREKQSSLSSEFTRTGYWKGWMGETTVIFNLLLQPGWLDYNHLYVFGKSLHQQEYKGT